MKKMKWVTRPCPVCGSRDQSHIFAEPHFNMDQLGDFAFASRKTPEYMHYRLVECPSCDLLYANPLPTLKALAQAYHQASFDSSQEAHFAARTYGRNLLKFMSALPEKKGALDIGTGDGAFLEELLSRGFQDVQGVEPSKAPIEASRPDVKPLIRHGLFNPKNYKKNSLNLMTCFQTLEHLYDPLVMAQGAHRILKKGGALFVVGHNRRSLSARILGTKSPIFDIEHLQLFSPDSLRIFLEKTGYERVRVWPIFNAYPIRYWIKLLPFPRAMKPALIQSLKFIGLGSLPMALPAGNLAAVGFKK
jgi:SAM-dependent methyltransferase